MEQEIVLSPDLKPQIMRKYLQAARSGGGKRLARLLSRIYNMLNARGEMDEKTVNVMISGGTVGVLNLGKVMGSIHSNVESLSTGGGQAAEVGRAITEIAEAIKQSAIPDSQKKDALETIDAVSSQAKEQPEKRSTIVIKALLSSLPGLIAGAETATKLWEKYGAVVRGYFGL